MPVFEEEESEAMGDNRNNDDNNNRNRRRGPPLPWVDNIGPLALGANHELPKGSRKHFPRFQGDGSQHPDDHLSAFSTACAVLHVGHEDVAFRLFVETLAGAAAEWFNHLGPGCINNWNTMTEKFLARFKPAEDSHQLFARLSNSKKEDNEPMREFVARFNRLVTRLSYTLNPSPEILLSSFVNALPSEIAFIIRSADTAVEVDKAAVVRARQVVVQLEQEASAEVAIAS